MDTSLEIQLIKKFFKKEKHERYIGFVSSEKNRKKLIEQLSHLKDLKSELFKEVTGFNLSLISSQLLFPSCYVISEDESVDGTVVSLEKINQITDSGYAMILIFGECNQVYFEGEPPNNRYISKY